MLILHYCFRVFSARIQFQGVSSTVTRHFRAIQEYSKGFGGFHKYSDNLQGVSMRFRAIQADSRAFLGFSKALR